MTDPSPPTSRVVDILELVASRDPQSLRAADLSRELGISKATGHAIVQTLCERGWLVRDVTTKTLSLGPGLGPVARAAHEQRRASGRALEAARGLAATTGYTASVVELVGTTMFVSSVDPGDPTGPTLEHRVTYAAPFGSLFAAWASPGDRADWFRRGLVTGPAATSYGAFLDQARNEGVLVERMSPIVEHVTPLLEASESGTVSADLRRMVRAVVDEVVRAGIPQRKRSADPQPVTSVAAPVLAADGRMSVALVVHPLQAISARELHRAKTLVVRAAEAVSRSAVTADAAGPRSHHPTPEPSLLG
ncbi:helix-turn-helix domain-containing protein [Nocardioides humilatus]|uniref:Helix-turn-helix domain-containing protein n=1 Tax=Nocardioides humilatus TaxID=2607660 RepID=A0A5B1L6V1_9ACTN|nr:helix-turn-helix domain-containing protein [Nocardioides humilatus]KAA1416403.1 helix-turn-helix domain-containing protein [Nocardioides humilatus]